MRRYAGMTGVFVGLEWSAMMTLAAGEGIAPGIASYLFMRIETGAMLADEED